MINNDGFDALVHGMSPLEIGGCACETVYTVINVCQIRGLSALSGE